MKSGKLSTHLHRPLLLARKVDEILNFKKIRSFFILLLVIFVDSVEKMAIIKLLIIQP